MKTQKYLPFTPTDKELINQALNYWANYIETGEVHLSARDKINMGQLSKPLDDNQVLTVLRLRELAKQQLQNNSSN